MSEVVKDSKMWDKCAVDVILEIESDVEKLLSMTSDATDLMFIERLLTVVGGTNLFADGFDVREEEIGKYFDNAVAGMVRDLLAMRAELAERKAEYWYDTDVISGYVSGLRFDLDVARREGIGESTDFELTREYVELFELTLGNFGYRESVVLERYGLKWAQLYEAMESEASSHGVVEGDVRFLAEYVKTVRKLVVENVNLKNTSGSSDPRAFRSYYTENVVDYERSKELTLELVRERSKGEVSYFSS